MKKQEEKEPLPKLGHACVKHSDWGTMIQTIRLDYIQLAVLLRTMFREAAARFDEERALQYLEYVLAHNDDVHAMPNRGNQSWPNRAETAMEIWQDLPDKMPGEGREWFAQDHSEPIAIQIPTLLKTKRALLDEVAKQWATTKEEKEARKLFSFLADAKVSETFKHDEQDCDPMPLKALGKGCDLATPSRILHALSLLPPVVPSSGTFYGWQDLDAPVSLRRKLVINLARKSSNFCAQATLVWAPLLETKSAPLADFVAALTHKAVRLDEIGQSLLSALEAPPQMPGLRRRTFSIEYHELGRIILTVAGDENSHNAAQDAFNLTRERLLPWLEQFRMHQVRVMLRSVINGGTQQERHVIREQEFS